MLPVLWSYHAGSLDFRTTVIVILFPQVPFQIVQIKYCFAVGCWECSFFPISTLLSLDRKESSVEHSEQTMDKLQGRLLKRLRKVANDYKMLEEGDNIMVCVSGGKDSATLLYLLRLLRERLRLNFDIVAVDVDQKQPGYDGSPLIRWMEDEFKEIPYHHVEEDTYSIVVEKTPEDKSFCTVCSRLRRGILYSKAIELGCNKIALGHHADDAAETLFLNMIHGGRLKGMPARYTSARGSLAVMRPLILCQESDGYVKDNHPEARANHVDFPSRIAASLGGLDTAITDSLPADVESIGLQNSETDATSEATKEDRLVVDMSQAVSSKKAVNNTIALAPADCTEVPTEASISEDSDEVIVGKTLRDHDDQPHRSKKSDNQNDRIGDQDCSDPQELNVGTRNGSAWKKESPVLWDLSIRKDRSGLLL